MSKKGGRKKDLLLPFLFAGRNFTDLSEGHLYPHGGAWHQTP